MFADVERIEQDDGPFPICSINYTQEYRQNMDIFRGICKRGEYSERVLELTWDIIQDNPGHYTVWKYRLDTLKHLKSSIPAERDRLERLASENPKSYQLWHHRQALAEMECNPQEEMVFLDLMIAEDSKNYHAWAYRQWLVKKFDLFQQDLQDTTRLIEEDVRNNSAWNQRYFCYKHTQLLDLEKETAFCQKMIQMAPSNPAPWNYLRAIYELKHTPLDSLSGFCDQYPNVVPSLYTLHLIGRDVLDKLCELDPIRKRYYISLRS
ncbi:hypothetical protein EDD86DRAFT_230568 [Gorgonomyces haynaldii]|nr:hypothetical protein EDD86DRAFT_230568 [Gorgonomyces haynaldii]